MFNPYAHKKKKQCVKRTAIPLILLLLDTLLNPLSVLINKIIKIYESSTMQYYLFFL